MVPVLVFVWSWQLLRTSQPATPGTCTKVPARGAATCSSQLGLEICFTSFLLGSQDHFLIASRLSGHYNRLAINLPP